MMNRLLSAIHTAPDGLNFFVTPIFRESSLSFVMRNSFSLSSFSLIDWFRADAAWLINVSMMVGCGFGFPSSENEALGSGRRAPRRAFVMVSSRPFDPSLPPKFRMFSAIFVNWSSDALLDSRASKGFGAAEAV
ncbi:unnamed protein product [Haemonchus placei]|uniref:Secreted protein n=1 Tax=Haemonchus placei TaxID=6290 RepID=A0A0N4X592_HAEPC|nr:unnamed protein product [Haemonchus placei]